MLLSFVLAGLSIIFTMTWRSQRTMPLCKDKCKYLCRVDTVFREAV